MTLVLGHGSYYVTTSDVRCSPIPLEKWINDEHVSVDICEDVNPDIIYDLREDIWTFAENNQYDRIIDTTGLGLIHRYKDKSFINEINRILRPNGVFYGRGNFIIEKTIF